MENEFGMWLEGRIEPRKSALSSQYFILASFIRSPNSRLSTHYATGAALGLEENVTSEEYLLSTCAVPGII